MTTNFQSRQNNVNQIFKPIAFFYLLLTGDTDITMIYFIVFTYFASVKGYEDDNVEVISYFHFQEPKLGGKMDQFGGKSK